MRRNALAVLPVSAVFLMWDYLAAARRLVVVRPRLPDRVWVGGLPIEELVFFLVIPVCGMLTFEGVRHVKPGWGVAADLPPHPADDPAGVGTIGADAAGAAGERR